jgi:hypothetical protein
VTKLTQAAETGRDDYLQQMQNVNKECQDIHDFLTGLLINISEDLTTIIRIIDIIAWYDANNGRKFRLLPRMTMKNKVII